MTESGFAATVAVLQERVAQLHEEHTPLELDLLLQDLRTAVEELHVADEEVRTQQAEVARLLEDRQLLQWRYDRMLASLPVPIVTTNARGQLRSVNAAAAALIGIPLKSLLQKPVFVLVETDDRAALRDVLADVARHGRPGTQHVRLRIRGEATGVVASLSPTPQTPGEVTWMFLGSTVTEAADVATDQPPLPEALLTLFALAERDSETAAVMQQTAYVAAEALGAGTAVSVSLGPPLAPTAAASSSRAAQVLDAWQLSTRAGPSVLASESRQTVVAVDLEHDPRWPAPVLEDGPPRAAVAAPLRSAATGEQPESPEQESAVLTAYLPADRPVTPRLVEQVEVLAASVGSLLQELDLRARLESMSSDMHNALASRSMIEQAKGIVMAAKHCSADEAFDHLVMLSNTGHLKLREVARQLVESAGG
jgi:PAS domain S-box-containing protein